MYTHRHTCAHIHTYAQYIKTHTHIARELTPPSHTHTHNTTCSALDAHCEGLRTALAGIEAEMTTVQHLDTLEHGCSGQGTAGESLVWTQQPQQVQQKLFAVHAQEDSEDEDGLAGEKSGDLMDADGVAEEKGGYNQCFSPLPTVSPSVDRHALEMSPLLTHMRTNMGPDYQQQQPQNQQHTQQTSHRLTHPTQQTEHRHQRVRMQNTAQLNVKQQTCVQESPRPPAAELVVGVCALMGGVVSHLLASSGVWVSLVICMHHVHIIRYMICIFICVYMFVEPPGLGFPQAT